MQKTARTIADLNAHELIEKKIFWRHSVIEEENNSEVLPIGSIVNIRELT